MSLYRDTILYYYKHPQNFGELGSYTHSGTALNPLCGDMLTVQLTITGNVIREIAWKGEGCAISQASMSLFSNYVKGKKSDILTTVTDSGIYELLGAPVTLGREKCALLPLSVVRNALD